MRAGEEVEILELEGQQVVSLSDASDMMNELEALRKALSELANSYEGNRGDVDSVDRLRAARKLLQGWRE